MFLIIKIINKPTNSISGLIVYLLNTESILHNEKLSIFMEEKNENERSSALSNKITVTIT